jgi:hypothetical protein
MTSLQSPQAQRHGPPTRDALAVAAENFVSGQISSRYLVSANIATTQRRTSLAEDEALGTAVAWTFIIVPTAYPQVMVECIYGSTQTLARWFANSVHTWKFEPLEVNTAPIDPTFTIFRTAEPTLTLNSSRADLIGFESSAAGAFDCRIHPTAGSMGWDETVRRWYLLSARQHVVPAQSSELPQKLLARFRLLADETKDPNWDFEGAPSIPEDEWLRASDLCREALLVKELPEPVPSPCGDGTIHLRWSKPDGSQVLLEMRGSQIWWSYRKHGHVESGKLWFREDAIELLRDKLA